MNPAPRAALAGRKRHKYRAKPLTIDGVFFASTKEARRWAELKLMERAGYIKDLKRQVRFALDVNGVPICHYVADATYERDGQTVVEDVKGVSTDTYKLKKKLMAAIHNIHVVEV